MTPKFVVVMLIGLGAWMALGQSNDSYFPNRVRLDMHPIKDLKFNQFRKEVSQDKLKEMQSKEKAELEELIDKNYEVY